MSERQLRAYVLPAAATVKMLGDGTVKAVVPLENSGQTPAKQCRVATSIAVLNYPYRGHIIAVPPPDDYRSVAPIRPHGDSVTTETKFVSPEDREAITKEKAIYVSGELTYLDVFDEEWTTKFRLFYQGRWGGTHPLLAAHEGNEST